MLFTFLFQAHRDSGLGNGIKDAAVLAGVVSVADALHLVAARLQKAGDGRSSSVSTIISACWMLWYPVV